jgi:hypothetical protein
MMHSKLHVFLLLTCICLTGLCLTGCASRQLTLVDFQTGQTLEGVLSQSDRSISVTMPDGEVLHGMFSAVSSASPVYETGIGVSSHHHGGAIFGTGIVLGSGPSKGYALLRSNSSNLMMEINVSYSDWTGHGYGEAVTNDGRKYKVQF